MYRIQPIHHTNNQVNLNKYKKTDVMSHLMGIETDMENHLKRTNTEKTYSEETFKKEERIYCVSRRIRFSPGRSERSRSMPGRSRIS